MVYLEDYFNELQHQLMEATKRGATSMIITASELAEAAGVVGSSDACFNAILSEIGPTDEVLIETDSGSDMAVKFTLPRRRS